jgi:uncharacterized protein with HEPN domain
MPPRQAAYLLDIFQSVEAIQSYVAGQTHGRFLQDGKTRMRSCAVSWSPGRRRRGSLLKPAPSFRTFHKIVGMRNRVVHDYGNVDFAIVWETVQTHLPLLWKELQAFFAERGEA